VARHVSGDWGLDCGSGRPRLLPERLPRARLLVLPPPTGYYDPAKERWEPLDNSLLSAAEVGDILRFLDHVLTWLLADDTIESQATRAEPRPEAATWIGPLSEQYRDLCQIEDTGGGAGTVAFVERLLHETGVLKALARPSWMP
jgi:hypothetical protein